MQINSQFAIRNSQSRWLWLALILFFVYGLSNPSAGSGQIIFPRPLSPRIANYQIQVQLDPQTKTLKGHELLSWRNDSDQEVEDLYFHLYLNAFKNEASTFMTSMEEARRPIRGVKAGEWGWIELTRLGILDGEELTDAMEYVQPDDGNPRDQTVLRVSLPGPLLPGGTIEVAIDFEAQLPRVLARTGYFRDFFMVAQWFPKIAVYTPAGWNAHQFHPQSEFFADFGVYEVEITLPQEFTVGAVGLLQEERVNPDGTKTLRYRAEDVHDFAWTAYPRFRMAKERAEGVEITLLYPPGRESQVPRHLAAAGAALHYFGQWYGPYPYPNLTIVDPPVGAGAAGGMEYPTLITTFSLWWVPRWLHFPELVTIHEFGHQYWYGLMANNEFEEPWLDEGFNSYSTSKVMEAVFGPQGSALDWGALRLPILTYEKIPYLARPTANPIYLPAWGYRTGGYGVGAYNKPTLVLRTLENYLGPEVMGTVMRTYAERWRFRHPTTQDFLAVAEKLSGRDLKWFFDQFIFGTGDVDYAVSRIWVHPEHERRGIFERDGQPVEVTGEGEADRAPTLYRSGVVVERLGEATFPVEIRFVFEGGEEVREEWDGQARWALFQFLKPQKMVSAEIDPEGEILLDLHRHNNSLTARGHAGALLAWCARFLFWLESLLLFVGSLS